VIIDSNMTCFTLLMSFSSNCTSSLSSKVEGEVVGSCPTRCMCNVPIKKKRVLFHICEILMLVLNR
jgi:hypothetical protein